MSCDEFVVVVVVDVVWSGIRYTQEWEVQIQFSGELLKGF